MIVDISIKDVKPVVKVLLDKYQYEWETVNIEMKNFGYENSSILSNIKNHSEYNKIQDKNDFLFEKFKYFYDLDDNIKNLPDNAFLSLTDKDYYDKLLIKSF